MSKKTDIFFFNQAGEHVGEILESVVLHHNSWRRLNQLSTSYGEQPIPLNVLSPGILFAFVRQGGIPAGAVFIQR